MRLRKACGDVAGPNERQTGQTSDVQRQLSVVGVRCAHAQLLHPPVHTLAQMIKVAALPRVRERPGEGRDGRLLEVGHALSATPVHYAVRTRFVANVGIAVRELFRLVSLGQIGCHRTKTTQTYIDNICVLGSIVIW